MLLLVVMVLYFYNYKQFLQTFEELYVAIKLN